MLASTQNGHRQEQGFTLVELAIVLVIVGLLIGGILKGQELIASTRVTSTAAQIRAIEAATNNFYDTFGSMPGDLANATARLPNCATAGSICNNNGTGNGQIAQAPSADIAAGQENAAFFGHLAAADLISGVLPDSLVMQAGQGLLGTPIGSGSYYRMGYHQTGALAGSSAATSPAGHYLALSAVPAGTGALSNASMENAGIQPKAAQKIDAKYDDGVVDTGSVLGANTTASSTTAGCINGNNYNSRNNESDCGVYIRFYQ